MTGQVYDANAEVGCKTFDCDIGNALRLPERFHSVQHCDVNKLLYDIHNPPIVTDFPSSGRCYTVYAPRAYNSEPSYLLSTTPFPRIIDHPSVPLALLPKERHCLISSCSSAFKGRSRADTARSADQSYDRVRRVPREFGTALITGRQQWHNN